MTAQDTYGGIEFGLSVDTGSDPITLTGTIDDSRYRFAPSPEHLGDGSLEGSAVALPLRFVELVALGPRPEPEPNAPVLFVEADGLEGTGRDALAAAWGAELREGTVIDGEDWALWSVWAGWMVGEEPIVDGLTFIDHERHGLAAVIESDEGIRIQPCTSTEAWIALCGLLPTSAELAGGEPTDPSA